MPGRDNTGPLGQGPMPGHGMGLCGGGGRGRGGGYGRGWGRRNMFHATGLTGWQRDALAAAQAADTGSSAPVAGAGSPQELAMLKQQADGLATALDEIRQRIEEIQRQRPTPEPLAEQVDG